MIDTMGFFVVIAFEVYRRLCSLSLLTHRVDQLTGDVHFEYFNLSTSHSLSCEYHIHWRLDTKAYIYDPGLRVPVLAEGLPYLRFEFSAPKVHWGHNLNSCSVSDAMYAANLVRETFQRTYNLELPPVRDWYIYRLDVCANFVLESEVQVRSYIRYLQRLDYPRRIKNLYEDTGVYFSSRYNTLKIYAKGYEFKKHDMRRFLSEHIQKKLLEQAMKILRLEVELKRRLLEVSKDLERRGYMYSTFRGYMRVYDVIERLDIQGEMKRTIDKFLCGSTSQSMRAVSVYDVLRDAFGVRKASSYYAVYTIIVNQGQKEAKRRFRKTHYYSALAAFRKLGISLVPLSPSVSNDCNTSSYDFPVDFSLDMSSNNPYYQVPTAVCCSAHDMPPVSVSELALPLSPSVCLPKEQLAQRLN